MRQLIVARQNNGFSLCWPEATTQKKMQLGLGAIAIVIAGGWGRGPTKKELHAACAMWHYLMPK